MSPTILTATVVIREILNERTWHATLPNGKQIIAFARLRSPRPDLKPGDTTQVWMKVDDFGRGEVVHEQVA
jgi:hypothetical protein